MSDQGQILVFDRALLRRRRDRAAANFAAHRALFEETGEQLFDRLSGIKEEFHTILDLGAHDGMLARHFEQNNLALVVSADLSEKFLRAAPRPAVAADEELLPFVAGAFDLVISNMSLHWVNDLPGAFAQIRNALKPGGLFLAALPGGSTLYELRTSLLEAEIKLTGGGSPRLSPVVDLPNASVLLQRAGFALSVTDCEIVTLTYPDIYALMKDLRGMGETALHHQRPRKPTRREIFLEADRIYRERFAANDSRLPATFEILFLHGRRPLT